MRIRLPAPLASLLAAALLAAAPPALADTLLRLTETAAVEMRPDQIVATLRAEASASSAAEAQQRVNAMMTTAIARARSTPGVLVSTGGYQVWRTSQAAPASGQAGGQAGGQGGARATTWVASQSLELTGAEGPNMLALVDALQQAGMASNRLAWTLAPETARKARREATEAAVKGLRIRAEEAASLLGLRFVAFKEVRLEGPRPGPMPRMMAAQAAAAAGPVAVSEDIRVEATAEADAILAPR